MTSYSFSNKKILIIGGTRGIGKAIAQRFLQLDGCVTITGTGASPPWVSRFKKLEHFKLNYLEPGSLERFITDYSIAGSFDILINNSGINYFQEIYKLQSEAFESVLRVNLEGPFHIINKLSNFINTDGRIVNIASVASLKTKEGSAAYVSSKSALVGLTRSVALDLAKKNILVNAVSPGATQTDMLDTLISEQQKSALIDTIPLRRFANPEEIANLVIFLCSELNTYITGQNLIIDGGVSIV